MICINSTKRLLIAACVTTGTAVATQAYATSPMPPIALTAPIINTAGDTIGEVMMREFHPEEPGALLYIKAEKLSVGKHGMHIHETGACDAKAGFTSAGGHMAGAHSTHGVMHQGQYNEHTGLMTHEMGHHTGDLPNIYVHKDGSVEAEYFMPTLRIRDMIMDQNGASLIIHADADDYTSQPAGNAGGRIACSVLSAGKK